MQASPVLSLSPSFNSYSSANLAEIAARVVEEFREEPDDELFSWDYTENKQDDYKDQYQDEDEEEEEFEFAVVCKKQDPPISADDIFFNGQIKPLYPLFDTNLLSDDDTANVNKSGPGILSKPRNRSPLGKLMSEERETDVSLSCSSSEADDLDSLEPGTYCVWTPKAASKDSTPGRRKKSNSTGTSKRWNKFRDLLYRSNSDGNDTFVFLTPSHNNNSKEASNKAVGGSYLTNPSIKQEDKKRSFLPYRQDLLGFISNVNGLSKNLRPL